MRAAVYAEQARLHVQQVRRIPLPHLLMDACLAWTGWQAGIGGAAVAWLAVMTVAQVGRTAYAVALQRAGKLPAGKLLERLTAMLVGLGALHVVLVALVFQRPVGVPHYIMTTIMVGTAAGAVSPAAGSFKSYVSWAAVFGGPLAIAWITRGTLVGTGMALLILFLFATLALYVRDQELTMLKLVSLTDSLRRERDRAERASEARTRFFAAASHDLRQPLTALSYNAATVRALAQRDGDETLARVGDGIARALSESRALLDSLLEVSKLDAGAVDVCWQVIDVNALLFEIYETFLNIAHDSGLELTCTSEDGRVLFARTDIDLLRRVLQNLVGNAVKFTQSGTVALEIAPGRGADAGQVVVRVRDTGPGIPVEAQEQVFEEFFQVGNPERNRTLGLGLGLSIVQRIVRLIDARVVLHSVPGEGSSFEVVLPPAPAPVALDGGSARLEALPAPLVGSVLVVDDEPDVRESLATLLDTLGWTVTCAAGRAEALQAWRLGFAPDAIVLDFRLHAGESGLDTLRELRAEGCAAPAVLITGDTEPKRIAAARASNIPVIYKPVDGIVLVNELQNVIAGQGGTELAGAPASTSAQ